MPKYKNYNDYLLTLRQLDQHQKYPPPQNTIPENSIEYANLNMCSNVEQIQVSGYCIVKDLQNNYKLIYHSSYTPLTHEEISLGILISPSISEYLEQTILNLSPSMQQSINNEPLFNFCKTIHKNYPRFGTFEHAAELMDRSQLKLLNPATFFKPFTSKYDAWNGVHGIIDYPYLVLISLLAVVHSYFFRDVDDNLSCCDELLNCFIICPLVAIVTLIAVHLTLLKNIVGLLTRTASTAVAAICSPESLKDDKPIKDMISFQP